MNRNLSTYKVAESQVKIAHFTANRGFDINGVIHIGVNDGYEMPWYLDMGIEHVIGIDPLPSVHNMNRRLGIPTYRCALGAAFGMGTFYMPEDPGGSSLLQPTDGTWNTVEEPILPFWYLAQLINLDLTKYDCLVLDVQGYELEVLRGMGELVRSFKYFNIECSKDAGHIYIGEPSAQEVIDYLKGYGIMQDTPICEHDDIMFLRKPRMYS